MSTQPGNSLVWQARIRHTNQQSVAAAVASLLLEVYSRPFALMPLRSARGFNPQTMAFRVSAVGERTAEPFPYQVNLNAPTELQSDDRIMWRVQAPDITVTDGSDGEWLEIGQVYWNLVDNTMRHMAMPVGGSAFARRSPRERRPRGMLRAVWGHDFNFARLTDDMIEWIRTDDRSGHILGPGAVRLVQAEGGGREHMGRIRDAVRGYEHFALLPVRVRTQGLRMLAQAFTRNSESLVNQFNDFMSTHHPMSLDQIESWVIERLVALGHHTVDELSAPEARASAIQAAMIRNNIREFDELTRLGLSCLGRARVRNDRATRYGSPTTSRNPCVEIALPMEGETDERTRQDVLRNGWVEAFERQHGLMDMRDVRAQGDPIERPIPAGTRVTIDAQTGLVRPARDGDYTFGIATGRSTPDGRIELSTGQWVVETAVQQSPERIRGMRSNVMIIDDSEVGLDEEVVRHLLGGTTFDGTAVTAPLTREAVEEARHLPRRAEEERNRRINDLENTRRAKRQQELRNELSRVLSQMFDPTVDDGAMPAADMALVHLRYRLHAVLTSAQVGRLKVEIDWNNDQALDVVIKDPQNENVELSRIRMDAPGEFIRNRLPEAEVGIGERAIDL